MQTHTCCVQRTCNKYIGRTKVNCVGVVPKLEPHAHWSRDKPRAGALLFHGGPLRDLVKATHNEKASITHDILGVGGLPATWLFSSKSQGRVIHMLVLILFMWSGPVVTFLKWRWNMCYVLNLCQVN